MPKSAESQSNVPARTDADATTPTPAKFSLCTTCNHRYPSPEALASHKARAHRGEGPARPSVPAREPKLPHIALTFYLTCPACLHIQLEQFYADHAPSHLRCERCDKIAPSELWGVTGYTNIPGPVAPWYPVAMPMSDRGSFLARQEAQR